MKTDYLFLCGVMWTQFQQDSSSKSTSRSRLGIGYFDAVVFRCQALRAGWQRSLCLDRLPSRCACPMQPRYQPRNAASAGYHAGLRMLGCRVSRPRWQAFGM
jgi:hypothetical protein